MKEVEAKAHLKDRVSVIAKLTELGCELTESVTQRDTVFLEPGVSYAEIKPGTKFLRIREQPTKTILTFKQRGTRELEAIEKEVVVDNAAAAADIVRAIGYVEALRINKTRQKTKYQQYEICLDDVEQLGSYIEVEKMVDDAEDNPKIQEELFAFLQTLGVAAEDREVHGYDTLIHRLNG